MGNRDGQNIFLENCIEFLHIKSINMEPTAPIDNCPYCTETTEYGSLVNFPCGHTVHYTCFIKAVKYNREHNQEIRCPLCRATVDDAVVPEMFSTVVLPITRPPQVYYSAESIEEHNRPPVPRIVYACLLLILIVGLGYLIFAGIASR